MYETRLSQGKTALSVFIDASPSIAPARVEDILEDCGASDLHLEQGTASSASIKPSAAAAGQTERVIPLPEEELKIGKRATEQVHRVKTYVVEEPVRENVQLHNERVTIEKRPATSANSGQPVEREYEVREHHGEPVVEKQTRAGEEVVIRKEADDRTERISDTVRKTKVDIGSTAKRR